jgi:GT2 family glycosyltransferase/glycosyltransferase involved in cell wall biosynthesis
MVYSSNIYKIIQYFYAASESDQVIEREIAAYFDALAEQIMSQIGPGSVLVVGGKSHYLVSALRARDVQAFGGHEPGLKLDDLPEEIRPFYKAGSFFKTLTRNYDLIVCLEIFPQLSFDEAEQACKKICASTNDVLFSATPYGVKGRTDLIIQLPGEWAALFARQDFLPDLNFSGKFISPWAFRFLKAAAGLNALSQVYLQRIWELEQQVQAQRGYLIEQGNELALKEMELLQANQQIAFKVQENEDILNSRSWRTMQKFQNVRLKLLPIGSRQEKWMISFSGWLRLWRREGTRSFLSRIYDMISWKVKVAFLRFRTGGRFSSRSAHIDAVPQQLVSSPHAGQVDIVVCVHNALEDVQRCLDSIMLHTSQPYSLILIDDGSDSSTKELLDRFSSQHGATLIRNEQANGYTRAANQGMKSAQGDFVVLLNSDTIVTSGWLDRMVTCAESDKKNGIVSPLSNTASWQSIPEIESHGDWASNPLPQGVSVEKMGRLVEKNSGYLFPKLPFLNGFCLMIRREVIDQIGYFDEELFGDGYGEENNYCLRARKAGWALALADQAFIYHAQSKSYSSERRKQLAEQAGKALAKKHGQRIIDQGVEICRNSPVLEGIRARSRIMFQREELIEKGERKFAGKRIQFILPIEVASGGGNVVITEARVMRAMGVEVGILNLKTHAVGFTEAYPDLDLPVTYVDIDEISEITKEYDAVVATFNPSVGWMMPQSQLPSKTILGYYIQDFEPYFYPVDSEGYHRAFESYTLIPGMRCMTKTEWVRQELRNQIGVKSQVVGPSFNIDLFRPRPRLDLDWPDRPLRIAAMVRTSSAYRGPRETMETLKLASRHFGGGIEIIIFGTSFDDPEFKAIPRDFAWSLAGMLTQQKMANLLNEVDIFIDFSTYQAMGLTALEAMACGVAVIVPKRGGINEIAKDHVNSLIIDTASEESRWGALKQLIEEHELRRKLQRNALRDVCDFYPEGPAFRILSALFERSD